MRHQTQIDQLAIIDIADNGFDYELKKSAYPDQLAQLIRIYTCPLTIVLLLGPVAQSVARRTVDPGVASLNLAQSHTFFEIDHEII